MEEWTKAGKGIEVSCAIADEDLTNAVMNLGSESKTLENESSDEVITERISRVKAADTYSTLLKFSETWPRYLAQEVMQVHVLHFIILQKQKECTKQADIRQMLQKGCKSHMDLLSYPEEQQ